MSQVNELLMIFGNNILPILIIAAIGVLLRRQLDIQPGPVGRIIFYVLSPCLVFWLLYTSDVGGREFVLLFGGTVFFQFTMATLGYGTAILLRASPVHRANLMIAAFCLNAGNFGLSTIDFAFGEEVLSRAVVVLVANVTINYSLGVFVSSNGKANVMQSLGNVARTPAIYAVAGAFLLRGFDAELPIVFARAIERLSQAAIPMMLLMLGLQLGGFTQIRGAKLAGAGVTLKLLVAPVIGTLIALLIGLEGAARIAFIMQVSMPTAVLTLIFSNQFDLDGDLALSLIMGATLLSPITLSVLILIFQG